ncbi:hypothetical protein CBOM_04524 [Ceraceosorus bombacis]|uniref:Transcription factor Iwr1 domain-containing protein n=1 Tax=Ceraceosorus bombacis TaxID=401625 RepID=A0A0P1BP97_9BASI|nr:hypothetical protein CBOM_04524 [Ceraceosorus bombacis]
MATSSTAAASASSGGKRVPKPISAPRIGDVWISPPPSPAGQEEHSHRQGNVLPSEHINEANAAAARAQAELDNSARTALSQRVAGGPGGGVILRIKRKRGQEPVDSLQIGRLLDDEEGDEVLDASEQVRGADGDGHQGQGRSRKRLSIMRGVQGDDKLHAGSETQSGLKRTFSNGTSASTLPTPITQSSKRSQTFRLAETVDLRHFSDPALAKDLSRRLANFSPRASSPTQRQSSVDASGSASSSASPAPRAAASISTKSTSKPAAGSPLRFQVIRNEAEAVRRGSKRAHAEAISPDQSPSLSKTTAQKGRNNLLQNDADMPVEDVASSAQASNSVPRSSSRQSVRSRTRGPGQLTALRRMRIIDAIAIDSQSSSLTRKQRREKRRAKQASGLHAPRQLQGESRSGTVQKTRERADVDAEMDALDRKFAGLLGDYLKETHLEPPSDLESSISRLTHSEGVQSMPNEKSVQSNSASDAEDSQSDIDSDEDDYVYDVYYRESASMSGSERWADLSNAGDGNSRAGLSPAPVAGHASSPAPIVTGQPAQPEMQHLFKQSDKSQVATLEGLRAEDLMEWPDDEEEYDLIDVKTGGPDSADEWDEGEDEDSNDEGFYRNDYPDRDVDSEDEMAWDQDEDEDDDDDY